MRKFLLIVPLLALLLTGCGKERELLKGLTQGQANEVIALLQQNNIDASKKSITKEGYRIAVEPADFAAAVDLMDVYGLPRNPRFEIAQLFPTDSLVSSPIAEKARLYSGIEQRLEQSLLSMQGVVSASVHASYNFNSSESEQKKAPVHLAALVKHDSSIKDATLLIGDVKRFLKNSFDNVDYDNISVVLSQIKPVQKFAPTTAKKQAIPYVLQMAFLGLALLLIAVIGLFWSKNRSDSRLIDTVKKYYSLQGKGGAKRARKEPTAEMFANMGNTDDQGKA